MNRLEICQIVEIQKNFENYFQKSIFVKNILAKAMLNKKNEVTKTTKIHFQWHVFYTQSIYTVLI